MLSTASAGTPLVQGYLIAAGDIQILVPMADIDVHQNKIRFQYRFVGRIVKINIKNLAVRTPVAAEIEDHAPVLGRRLLEGSRDIGRGLFRGGINLPLERVAGLRDDDRKQGE